MVHKFAILIHWLTPEKGVHLFRNSLPIMRTPFQLLAPHAYSISFVSLKLKEHNACTRDFWCMHCAPSIQDLHQNTIEMHICMRRKHLEWCTRCKQEVSKKMYTLLWCKPVDRAYSAV